MTDSFAPGVMISQLAPASTDDISTVTTLIHAARESGLFECVQVRHPVERATRSAVRTAVAGLGLTTSLAHLMPGSGINPSSLDSSVRRRSLQWMRERLAEAAEMGARWAQIVSGPGPHDQSRRPEALSYLVESMVQTLDTDTGVGILIEPLDVAAHKKGTLGYTDEAVALAGAVLGAGPNRDGFALCLDTSHMLLNGEDLDASAKSAADVTAEVHLCNPCLIEDHELFGDRHIPFGPPGVIALDNLGSIVLSFERAGLLGPRRPGLFLEVLNFGEPPLETLEYHMRAMRQLLSCDGEQQ